jgi:4-amino-4-deoxy-L-arabinose transferase-like glycosyltransferase
MNQSQAAQIKIRNFNRTFLILLIAWFLINLIQAYFMEIMSDEAYYGLYAANPAWGYYDHPPMIALLIRISSFIFSGNLGIRFMTVFLQTGTLILIWNPGICTPFLLLPGQSPCFLPTE